MGYQSEQASASARSCPVRRRQLVRPEKARTAPGMTAPAGLAARGEGPCREARAWNPANGTTNMIVANRADVRMRYLPNDLCTPRPLSIGSRMRTPNNVAAQQIRRWPLRTTPRGSSCRSGARLSSSEFTTHAGA